MRNKSKKWKEKQSQILTGIWPYGLFWYYGPDSEQQHNSLLHHTVTSLLFFLVHVSQPFSLQIASVALAALDIQYLFLSEEEKYSASVITACVWVYALTVTDQ